MAKKKTEETEKSTKGGKGKVQTTGLLTSVQKNNIFGLFFIVFALFQLVSILSYSPKDIAKLTYKLKEPAINVVSGVNNWLGVIGAYFAHYLIRDGLGFFSLCLPVIMAIWGYWIIYRPNHRKLLNISNFLFFFSFLSASLMGVLRYSFTALEKADALSGQIGYDIGGLLTEYLGSLGGAILLITLLLTLFIIAIDLKISTFIDVLKKVFHFTAKKVKEKRESTEDEDIDNENEVDDSDDDNAAIAAILEEKKEVKKERKGLFSFRRKKDDAQSKTDNEFNDSISDFNPLASTETVDKKASAKVRKVTIADSNESLPELNIEPEAEEIPLIKPVTIIRNNPEPDLEAELPIFDVKKSEPASKPVVIVSSKNDSEENGTDEEDETSNDEKMPALDYDELAKLPDPWDEKINYTMIPTTLLNEHQEKEVYVAADELNRNGALLQEKLSLFSIDIQRISAISGPVVTLFEIVPAPGIKISKIVGLENDIAMALAAQGVRIIAPIPGKGAIGVEIPNSNPSMVGARSVIEQMLNKKLHKSSELPVALGRTISGDVYVADLAKVPHLLIAGATGSGKSVGVNMLISSLLFTKHPSEVKFAIIDPKKIELSFYRKLRHHYLAISPDFDEEIVTEPANAVFLLKSVVLEMEKRYDMLAKAYERNIVDYNRKVLNPKTKPKDTDKVKHHFIPYIVVVIDELADLMITAGKEIEEPIARIAQMARAVGIHLVVATQRPSVNVITGVIKANFPARIAYQTASKIDSRTILDMNGAEQLLGRGDMLYLPSGLPKPVRIQNAFITTDEVEIVTDYINNQPGFSKAYILPSIYERKDVGQKGLLNDLDPKFEDAARTVVTLQSASTTLLQRKLKLGYSRAARVVDQLEAAGIVGPNQGAKGRAVLLSTEEELDLLIRNL